MNKVPEVSVLPFMPVFHEKVVRYYRCAGLLCNGEADQCDLWVLSKGNLLLKIISFVELTWYSNKPYLEALQCTDE